MQFGLAVVICSTRLMLLAFSAKNDDLSCPFVSRRQSSTWPDLLRCARDFPRSCRNGIHAVVRSILIAIAIASRGVSREACAEALYAYTQLCTPCSSREGEREFSFKTWVLSAGELPYHDAIQFRISVYIVHSYVVVSLGLSRYPPLFRYLPEDLHIRR